MILLPVQCQMARAGLGWSLRDLAAAAKVGVDTVTRFERGDPLKERTVEAIQHALETAGIEFIAENGGGPGVRLRKPVSASAKPTKPSERRP
jgi:transcriptional regulator with XRE-family HTH domain